MERRCLLQCSALICLSFSLGLCFLAFSPVTIFPHFNSRKREHERVWLISSPYHHPWHRAYYLGPAHRSLVSLWTSCARIGYVSLAPFSACNGVKWHGAWPFLLENGLQAVGLWAGQFPWACRHHTHSFSTQTDGRVMPLHGCAGLHSPH